jgi:subtilisin family serine protease
LASNYNNQGVYFLNSNYKQFMDSGTSMASPQIAGMAALYLQLHPTATPSAVKSWIVGNADKNSLYSTGLSTDYDNNRSLQGSTGGIAYQALNGASFVKTDTANWSPVKAMFIKTNATTWTPVKQAYIKTDAVTWKPVY